MVQLAFLLVLLVAPRPPHVDGHADRAVAEHLALGGEGEDVRHEHRRHLLLVDLVDLERAVEPSHRAARRRLGLADDQRQAVDEEHHVEALLHRAGLVGPLVGDRRAGCSPGSRVHEADGHVLAVGAEGHGLLAAQPGHEILVGPHQAVGLHGEQDGAQLVDHLVGAVGLGGDLGVEPDERLAQPRLHHHVAGLTRNVRGRLRVSSEQGSTLHRANRPNQAHLRARPTRRHSHRCGTTTHRESSARRCWIR